MSATFWHVIIAGIPVLAAVLIFIGRQGIRSRFVRNMPIDRPYERPSWLPVPRLALPPSEPSPPATERGWLMRGEQAVSPEEAFEKAKRVPGLRDLVAGAPVEDWGVKPEGVRDAATPPRPALSSPGPRG